MKNSITKTIIFSLLSTTLLASNAFAGYDSYIKLVNHTKYKLNIIPAKNSNLIPQFTNHPHHIKPGQSAESELKYGYVDPKQEFQDAYMRIVEKEHRRQKNDPSTFLGVGIEGGTVKVHGLVFNGLSYSWKTANQHVITFCSPQTYKAYGYCP